MHLEKHWNLWPPLTSATLQFEILDGPELPEYPLIELEGSFFTLKDVDLYLVQINAYFSFKGFLNWMSIFNFVEGQKMAKEQIYGQFKPSFLPSQKECQIKYYVLLPVAWFDFEHNTNITTKYYLYLKRNMLERF